MESLVMETSAALNQMLDPLSESLTVEAAEAILALRIGADLEARIEELADRSNEGLLTDAERAEYRGYVEGAEILALIKLKARRLLTEQRRE
jgi:hypothetical protein